MTTQDTNEAALWICLQQISGLGGQGICKLLSQFGSPENIFSASHQALKQVVSEAVSSLIKKGPDLITAEPGLQWLEKDDNHLITLADAHYPQALLEIPDPPPNAQIDLLRQYADELSVQLKSNAYRQIRP